MCAHGELYMQVHVHMEICMYKCVCTWGTVYVGVCVHEEVCMYKCLCTWGSVRISVCAHGDLYMQVSVHTENCICGSLLRQGQDQYRIRQAVLQIQSYTIHHPY